LTDLRKIVNILKKTYSSVEVAEDRDDIYINVTTGNKALDLILDGGIPFGYITEFLGFSQSGKSLFIQQILANAQRDFNAFGILIDRENAYTKERGKQLNINNENLIVSKPQDTPTVIEAFQFMLDSLDEIRKQDKETPIVLGIDSISAFGKDTALEKSDQGRKAKSVHEGLRELLTHIDKNTMVLVANQFTYKIGVIYGDNRTSTSGESMKYYGTNRIALEDRKKIIDETKGGEITGNWIGAEVIKTRRGPCYRECYLPHFYSTGIDYFGGYARLLADRGYLDPRNKSEFKSFKQHTLKYTDITVNEFKMEKFLEEYPELDFKTYPEYNPNKVKETKENENEE